MVTLNSFAITYDIGMAPATQVTGTYVVSGGIITDTHHGSYTVRTRIPTAYTAVDFRYAFRLTLVSDSSVYGTADFSFAVATAVVSIDTSASHNVGTNFFAGNVGSHHLNALYTYDGVAGSANTLGNVITFTNGTFRISLEQSFDDKVPAGSYSVGVDQVFYLKDVNGEYGVYAIVDGVMLRINVIPEETRIHLEGLGFVFN